MTTHEAKIVGIGETAVGIFPGRTAVDLQGEAIVRAVRDAGLKPTDVDGLFVLGPYSAPSSMFGLTVGESLGLKLNTVAAIDSGGTVSCLNMLLAASRAIETGECRVAVCAFGENGASARTDGEHGFSWSERLEFEAPYGILGAVIPYALAASMYMTQYGLEPADLGAIAISARKHASRRDNAYRKEPLDLERYLTSRMIADPLRLLDCSSIVDGAGAIVLARRDIALACPHPLVTLLASAARFTHRMVGQFTSFDDLRLAELGRTALGAASVQMGDIDVMMMHDAFTISPVVFLEGLGICDRGAAGAYARAGNLDLGARCPLNTHGGLLSQGHVGGILHFVEAVRQLRGQAGSSQVLDAELAMVVGGGGIFGINAVAIFGRDR